MMRVVVHEHGCSSLGQLRDGLHVAFVLVVQRLLVIMHNGGLKGPSLADGWNVVTTAQRPKHDVLAAVFKVEHRLFLLLILPRQEPHLAQRHDAKRAVLQQLAGKRRRCGDDHGWQAWKPLLELRDVAAHEGCDELIVQLRVEVVECGDEEHGRELVALHAQVARARPFGQLLDLFAQLLPHFDTALHILGKEAEGWAGKDLRFRLAFL